MRHLYSLLFVGVTMLALLAGCSSGTITTGNVAATNTTAAAPTETATATTSVSATATSSSHPSATHTPTSTSHPPTQTPTSTIKNCGVVTSNGTTTTPSNPQPDEDCFTQAFMTCQPAKFEINVTDNTGTTTDDKMSTQQGCNGASVTEHKHSSSMDTTTTFTCNAMVPSGQKYSLRECTNNEWIFFP